MKVTWRSPGGGHLAHLAKSPPGPPGGRPAWRSIFTTFGYNKAMPTWRWKSHLARRPPGGGADKLAGAREQQQRNCLLVFAWRTGRLALTWRRAHLALTWRSLAWRSPGGGPTWRSPGAVPPGAHLAQGPPGLQVYGNILRLELSGRLQPPPRVDHVPVARWLAEHKLPGGQIARWAR